MSQSKAFFSSKMEDRSLILGDRAEDTFGLFTLQKVAPSAYLTPCILAIGLV